LSLRKEFETKTLKAGSHQLLDETIKLTAFIVYGCYFVNCWHVW